MSSVILMCSDRRGAGRGSRRGHRAAALDHRTCWRTQDFKALAVSQGAGDEIMLVHLRRSNAARRPKAAEGRREPTGSVLWTLSASATPAGARTRTGARTGAGRLHETREALIAACTVAVRVRLVALILAAAGIVPVTSGHAGRKRRGALLLTGCRLTEACRRAVRYGGGFGRSGRRVRLVGRDVRPCIGHGRSISMRLHSGLGAGIPGGEHTRPVVHRELAARERRDRDRRPHREATAHHAPSIPAAVILSAVRG